MEKQRLSARERLALCLIVGNEPKRLDRCLSLFAPAVSELVVVHAHGGTPASLEVAEVCKKRGAVYEVYANAPEHAGWPHVDNFAAARQKSFDLSTKEFLLWVDSDDTPGPDFAPALHELLDKFGDEFDGFCLNHDVAGRGIAHNLRERVLRRGKFKWRGRIHENCLPIEPKAAKMCRCTAPVVVHLPDDEPKQGSDRNLRILESIPEEERSTSDLYHLSGEYMGAGRKDEAARLGKLAFSKPDCGLPEKYELCLNLADIARPPVIEVGTVEHETMLTALHHAYRLMPWRREALALLGAMHLDLGDYRAAEGFLRAMMALPEPEEKPWTHRAGVYGWAGEQLWTQLLRLTGRGEMADKIERARLTAWKEKNPGRPTISICHPTRGRPQQAASVRKKFLDACADASRVEYIFGLDQDSEDLPLLGRFHHAVAPEPANPKGNSVAPLNAAVRGSVGQIVVCVQDDLEPFLHWDMAAEKALAAHLDKPALLQVGDGYRTDNLICTYVFTRPLLWKLGYSGGIVSDEYRNMFSDTELTVRAQAKNWVVPSGLVFKHEHPIHTGRPMDEHTARQNSRENYDEGRAIFERRNPGVQLG